MENVISINNEAVMLIEQRQLESALELLTQALANVQDEVDHVADEDEHDHQPRANPETPVVYSFLDSKTVQQRRQASMLQQDAYCCCPTASMPEQCGADFVYKHPIHANPELANDRGNGFYILSVILVFNLGLTHHLMALGEGAFVGTHNGESNEEGETHRRTMNRHLKSALRLYELGFHMQMKGCVSMDMTYAMAMVNNCASIYQALNRTRRAQKFFQHLLSSLLFLVENGEAEYIDELDGFLWNASRTILSQNVAAAAA